MQYLKQSTAVTVPYGPFIDTDGASVTTLTIQKADVRIKKNGGNMAPASADQGVSDAGAPHDEIGVYDGSFDTTDTNTLGRLDAYIVESGAIIWRGSYMVVTAETFDTMCSTDKHTVDLTAGALAAINAEAVDALNVDTYAEPGQGNPPATASIVAKIGYLFKSWRNLKENDGSVTNLYNDAGDTVDQKQTTSEAAGTVTKAEWVTGP